MWLERFIFCGKTIGPTNNTLKMAGTLAGGNPVPLGKHLLGSVYDLLHQVSATPTSVVSINSRWSYPGLNTKWYLKNYLFRWMERPKNLLRPGYWSWYTILLQRRSWCPCLLPPGSKFWICIPGASAINLKMMIWSGHYKADKELGYLQINVSSNSACTQGGSVYIIWVRYKADKSNTDWCKFYEESIYRLSKGQEDSAARLVESQPIGQKKLVAVHVQSLTQWLQDSYLHQLGSTLDNPHIGKLK